MMRRSLRQVCLCAALAAGLIGCQSNRAEVFAPNGRSVPGANRVDMLVATTRAPAENPAELFSGERGRRLSLTEVTISIPPAANRQIGEVQWPSSTPGNAATDFVVLDTKTLDPAGARQRLRERLRRQGHGRVLVFVHGYNNRFADAVFRFAQIAHDSSAPAVPVLFTWPSRASALAYVYDRESANYSRDALELALRTLAAEPAVREIEVLAHSMGNWLTLEALRQIAIRDGSLPAKMKNVMIAAPDVDVDVFGTQIARMGQPRPRFTLFASQDDKALAFSRRIAGDVPRLGAIDPKKEPLRSQLAAQGVEVVDLTDLASEDRLNHGKFAASPEVVRFIGRRLASGQTVHDGGASLGDHIGAAASMAGSVAGLVITAPVAIVDPGTRATFGTRLADTLGTSATN